MKKTAKFLTVALAAAMLSGTVLPVSAATLTQQKLDRISHPDNVERQADGLVEVGDRETSYAWCMAARGNYVYIGTNKDIVGSNVQTFMESLKDKGISEDQAWAMADVLFNGEVPHPATEEGGQILRCDCRTNEIKVIYTAPAGTSFRMAITHGDNVFFGSYASGTSFSTAAEVGLSNDIFRIDMDDNVEKVFSSFDGTSMRAAYEFEGQLYFGGVDASEEIEEGWDGSAKLAILAMDEDDNSKWNRVADYKDFGLRYAADPAMTSAAASPVWDICGYNGELYATLPNVLGFAMFKGHPAKDGEIANAYGWVWEEVVGFYNGINPIGMNPEASAATAATYSVVATPVVFNNELYVFDFDHTIGSELQALTGMFQQIAGQDVKPSDYLRTMYNTLRHPQNLWKLNNETGAFERVEDFTEKIKDTTVEYVWRAQEYNGQLYLTTMDSAVLYNYVTRLTNGSFIFMTKEEWKEQIGYLLELVRQFTPDGSPEEELAEQTLRECAEELQTMYDEIADNSDVQAFVEKFKAVWEKLQPALEKIKESLAQQEFVQKVMDVLRQQAYIAKSKLDQLEWRIKAVLYHYDLSYFIAPDLEVPLSTLSDEELQEYIDNLKLKIGTMIDSLYVEIPEFKRIDKDTLQIIVASYVSALIDKTIGQELFEAATDFVTAFKERVKYQTDVATVKVLAKMEELYQKLPEEKQATIAKFLQKYLVEIPQIIQKEYEEKLAELTERVEAVAKLTIDDYNSIAASCADSVAEHALGVLADVNEKLASYGLSIPEEQIARTTVAIEQARDKFKETCEAKLSAISEDTSLTPAQAAEQQISQQIAALNEKLNTVYYTAKSIYDKIDWEGLKMYAYISDMVKNDIWGFDMLRTADGETFEYVTPDGFGDRYNYGGRSMVATPYGLYIGTANPFYGAQLYRLRDELQGQPSLASETIQFGEQATVNLSCTGGTGEYSHTVLYRKAGMEHWRVAAKNTTESSVSFTPASGVSYEVRVISKDSEGSVVKNTLRLNVQRELENQSTISAESITLGDTVKVRGIAKGGDGQYQYAFYYKKSSTQNWIRVHDYSDVHAVNLHPASATQYDVRVSIKDGSGTEVEETMSFTVTK